MHHARRDYNPIQDPREGGIPHDEPVMLFRAQDKHFVGVLTYYREALIADGANPEMVKLISDHIQRAAKWPVKKTPDVPDKVIAASSVDAILHNV